MAYFFLPLIGADYQKLDTTAWRVASHLQCSKKVNIKLGVQIRNAVDLARHYIRKPTLVGTKVENSEAPYFIRE